MNYIILVLILGILMNKIWYVTWKISASGWLFTEVENDYYLRRIPHCVYFPFCKSILVHYLVYLTNWGWGYTSCQLKFMQNKSGKMLQWLFFNKLAIYWLDFLQYWIEWNSSSDHITSMQSNNKNGHVTNMQPKIPIAP